MNKHKANQVNTLRFWLLPASLAIFLLAWDGLAHLGNFPSFILPTPLLVAERFGVAIANGSLLRNLGVTLLEISSGLVIGCVLASLLGYFLAHSWALERILSPYLVASQAVPLVAIAPLLVIWFGPGLTSKILICALTVFFSDFNQYSSGAAGGAGEFT